MSSVDQRLARLLDSSQLARLVPHLAPETLHQLIRHQGLEACGALVTAASAAQLTSVLDLDLWHSAQPGRDEQFDIDRFAQWIEVLVDTGDSIAARTVVALDPDLVVAGLSRHLRVFDPGIFEPTAQTDDETIDRHEAMREGDALYGDSTGDRLTCEVGGYILRARRDSGWDAIIALLAAVETEYPDQFHALMRGCCALSNSRPELDGLDDLLLEPEQHLHEVALEREERRSRQGYATAADARAFLQLARQPKPPHGDRSAETHNPISSAYFRATDITPDRGVPGEDEPAADSINHAALAGEVTDLLVEAGVIHVSPRALLPSADNGPVEVDGFRHVQEFMARARDAGESTFDARSQELAFLANVLAAGCSIQSRSFTPREASEAAAGICNLGLEVSPGTANLITAFEDGWRTLYREVSLSVSHELIAVLDDLRHLDPDLQHDVTALRRAVAAQLDAGTPWKSRAELDTLAIFDVAAWTSVAGLLDECPVVPAALSAILDGSTAAIDPRQFRFISCSEQIHDVRRFMQKLPKLLSGA